ncbi:MAG: S4 domain-containing protein, partial [Bacteroidota bacterium]
MIIDDKYYEDDDTGDDSHQPKPDLYEHHRIVVDKGQGLIRIDKYLTNLLGGVSRTRFQNAADFGFITVNGETVKSSYRVKPLDEIVISLQTPPSDYTIVPQDIPLSVVFEDDDIMVVNKTPDMVVHPGVGNL